MPPTGLRRGRVSALVARALDRATARRGFGEVLINCGFRLGRNTVQAPDVAWICEEHRSMVAEKLGDFAPDLAVEILSPSDNAARLQRKITNYFNAGTSVVWVLDADLLTVTVYEKPGVFQTLNADDTIDAPALLPGFSLRVRTLFE